MAKIFRPSNREAKILSKIESSKEYARKQAINKIQDCIDPLSNSISMKLIEDGIVETTNKNALEEHIKNCLEKLSRADDFDIDYQIAPFRLLVSNPNVISIYVTAFVIEQLINIKDIVDVFGADQDIYSCINRQVTKYLP